MKIKNADESRVVALPQINEDFNLENRVSSVRSLLHTFRPDLSQKLETWTLEVQELSGGITNRLVVAFFSEDKAQDKTLFRVYGKGTHKMIDREAEIRMLRTLHTHNCCGKVYGIFGNGMCYQYVPGQTLTWKTVREDHIGRLIAEKMAEQHSISKNHIDELIPEFDPYEKMAAMFRQIPMTFDDKEQQSKYEKMFPHPENLAKEIEILRKHFADLDIKSAKVFCHNDLNFANVLYNAENDQVCFIDFEYAGFNLAAYDIANHFIEYAGVDDCDCGRFPSYASQRSWLKYYLEHLRTIQINGTESASDMNGADKELDHLLILVNKFTLVAHLFWIIWSLVQAKNSTIDHDFIAFGKTRYDEYLKRKEKCLALTFAMTKDI